MSNNLIANRYAKALLSIAAKDSGAAERYANFLETTAELFKIPESKKILRSPVMSADIKRALLAFAIEKSGAGSEATKFAEQLIAASRVGILPEIADSYRKMLDESRGVAHAVVTTAEPMPADFKGELEKTLSTVFKKKLTLDNKVNRSILGGLVVEVGNFAIDMSVKRKLETVAECAQH